MLARFGGAEQALAAVPDLAARGGGRAPSLFSEAAATAEIARVEALGARYLALGQGLYPRALAELTDAPPLITVKGNPGLLDRPLVAIVGARNASAAACRFARGWRMISAVKAWWWCRGWRAESIARRMTDRWRAGRSGWSRAGSTSLTRRRMKSASG